MRRLWVGTKLFAVLVGVAAASAGVLAVVAVTGSARIAAGSPQFTAASNRIAAVAAAGRTLSVTPLPAGASEVSANPASSTWLKYSAASAPATAELVDVHRFWRVPGDPKTVINWIQAHPPADATVSSTGTRGQYGITVMWSVTFAFRPLRGQISEEGLGVAVTAARGGGTAMRADGYAIWLIPRPVSEVVPVGIRAVAVFVARFGGRAFPVSTLIAGWKVRRLVAFVNSLQVGQGGEHSCPLIGAFTRILDLRFLRTQDTAPLARAVQDGCGGLAFSIRGVKQPGLSEDANLRALLWQLKALPVCRAWQLSASVSPVTRSPASPELSAQLVFRNTSSTVCSLKGFARLRLRDARERPVRTRVSDVHFPAEAVILASGDQASISLGWRAPSPTCKASSVADVVVSLPRVRGQVTIHVGSREHSFAPCRGDISADAIS